MPATDPSFNADPSPDDLRASLSASYDQAEQAMPAETDSSSAVRQESPVEPAQDAATTADTPAENSPESVAASTSKADHPTDPKRYADGSFKPTKAASAETAAPAKTDEPSKDTKTQANAAASTPASVPPSGWTAAEKAEWSKLSPVAQAAVSRRETEIANGGKQWSEEKRRYEAMIAPVAESARARGMDAAQGLQTLVAAQRALDTDPVNAIKHIARSYGVDLATLAGTQAANGSPEASQQPSTAPVYRDPRVDHLLAAQQARDDLDRRQGVEYVTTFANSPGHEHYGAVESEILALIPIIQATNPTFTKDQTLQDAYDRATFANPTTRAAILAANETAAEAKRAEAAKQRTQTARRTASSVTGAPSGAPATQAMDTLRAEIERNMESVGA